MHNTLNTVHLWWRQGERCLAMVAMLEWNEKMLLFADTATNENQDHVPLSLPKIPTWHSQIASRILNDAIINPENTRGCQLGASGPTLEVVIISEISPFNSLSTVVMYRKISIILKSLHINSHLQDAESRSWIQDRRNTFYSYFFMFPLSFTYTTSILYPYDVIPRSWMLL